MNTPTINDIISFLDKKAAPSLQESYDNAGLITGNRNETCTGVLVCLDSTEKIVDEAIRTNCNLIIAHHPIIFKGLKSLTGKNYIERTIIKAIQNNIAIYATHTNLDNVHYGVNAKIAEKIGLESTRILTPKGGILNKLVVFTPQNAVEPVKQAMFKAGAGQIGEYDSCSYSSDGTGSFRGGEESNPHVGEKGKYHLESEQRIETIVPDHILSSVINAMESAHPYEEVAYDIYKLENKHGRIGAGMIGSLKEPMEPNDFMKHLKDSMDLNTIRHTDPIGQIKNVAICGGAGSFLLKDAIRSGADVFITGDFKYHEFFDADNRIMICDIGHYESERYTIELLAEWLKKKFANFAVRLTEENTNPINYF